MITSLGGSSSSSSRHGTGRRRIAHGVLLSFLAAGQQAAAFTGRPSSSLQRAISVRRQQQLASSSSSSRSCVSMNYAPVVGGDAPEPLVSGTALVSGFLDAKERTDQFVFDLLHKQGVFTKIVAYNGDVAFAKKRLISRSARYSGLTNVLEYMEGTEAELLDASKLSGVDAWLSFGVAPGDVAAHAAAAAKAGVKSLVVVAVGEGTVDFGAAEAAAGELSSFTFLQVAEVVEGATKEGGPMLLTKAGGDEACTLTAGDGVPREDAVRVAAEAFQLPPAQKAGFMLAAGNETAAAYLKSLRSEGYTRPQEIGFLMTDGFSKFTVESALSAEESAKKKAEADKPFEPTQTVEEQEAQIRELQEKNRQKRKERREEKLRTAAEMDLRVEFIKQKFKSVDEGGGITDEAEYFEANLDRAVEDLRAISYFDERDNLITVRAEDLVELEDDEDESTGKKDDSTEDLDTVTAAGSPAEKEE